MNMFRLSSLGLALACGLAWTVPSATDAQAASRYRKPPTCAVIAKRAADDKARERIFKTALTGGMSALVVGALISQNNKSGKIINRGFWGGGVISGKAYRVQWQKDYAAARRTCRR
jgi:hypothetical protein